MRYAAGSASWWPPYGPVWRMPAGGWPLAEPPAAADFGQAWICRAMAPCVAALMWWSRAASGLGCSWRPGAWLCKLAGCWHAQLPCASLCVCLMQSCRVPAAGAEPLGEPGAHSASLGGLETARLPDSHLGSNPSNLHLVAHTQSGGSSSAAALPQAGRQATARGLSITL